MDNVASSGIIRRVESFAREKLHDTFGLFSVPAPLFASLQMAGFFRFLFIETEASARANCNLAFPRSRFGLPYGMRAFWTLQETIAKLDSPQLPGEVDVLFPWHGFRWSASAAQAQIAILKVFTRASAGATPDTLVDCYQRGLDLVATYAQTPERNVRPQVYWRYVEPNGLELVLSSQTSLLDSQPLTSLESALPDGEALGLVDGEWSASTLDNWQTDARAPRANLFRPSVMPEQSYLELVHPTDFAGVQLSRADGLLTLRWRLFPEPLEKGVIRRGRVRGYVLPRAKDAEAASKLVEEFARSALVLST
jgi:hypothetical protein